MIRKNGNGQVDRGSDRRRSEQESEVMGRTSSDMEKYELVSASFIYV